MGKHPLSLLSIQKHPYQLLSGGLEFSLRRVLCFGQWSSRSVVEKWADKAQPPGADLVCPIIVDINSPTHKNFCLYFTFLLLILLLPLLVTKKETNQANTIPQSSNTLSKDYHTIHRLTLSTGYSHYPHSNTLSSGN